MNAGKIIKLTDGTTIEAKMNFGTIFYLDQMVVQSLDGE